MSFTESQVQQALAEVVDPNTGKDLVATKSVKAVRIDAGSASVDVERYVIAGNPDVARDLAQVFSGVGIEDFGERALHARFIHGHA